ncbi:MAG: arginine ABC transporter permease ArtQ [Marinomonas sp.]|nr:MAG: arginine ABC transporter permease ArtQ [Marinomonas sp.]
MENLISYIPILMKGTLVTVELGILSLVLSVVLGLLGAWGKLSKSRVGQSVSGIYTTLIRGIPDLVLMLLLYFGGQTLLNDIGESTGLWGYVEINQFTAGVLTIGFIFGAYMTETFRGAFLAVPPGQLEAGTAYGMRKAQIFRRIIWPQLIRFALPSFGNNWLVLLKTTALVSVIGLQDVVYLANTAGRTTHEPFTFFGAVLLIYLILSSVSDVGLRWLDRKYSAGVRRV